jgi:hypothetical protein
MKLRHVHLFGILLLSLVLASFLGKYIDFEREGLENEKDNTSNVTNQHTGGDGPEADAEGQGTDEGDDADAAIPPNTGRSAEATYGNESTVADADTGKGVEGFGGLFDSVLPANSGFMLEQFISPFSNIEGLEGGSGSGITQDQIPKGQEHLYILKSQVVPPTTCPVCPSFGGKGDGAADSEPGGGGGGSSNDSSGLSNGLGSAFPGGSGGAGGSSSKCPPCPACARCPEPSFECKKVPNYAISQNGTMSVPRPVLADFSQFGM